MADETMPPPKSSASTDPSPAPTSVGGVTFDGEHVWLAAGDTLNAFDPETGKMRALDRCRRARRNRLRRASICFRSPKIASRRSTRRPAVCSSTIPRRAAAALRPRLGGRDALGRAAPRPQDPSDRSRNRRRPAHHRVQPLRHRRHLGRGRVLARRPGKATTASCGASTLAPAMCWRASTCRQARACRGSSPMAAISFFCGGGRTGKVRVVRRPKRATV